ncbi:hypothetical protein Rleg9DRAFT_1412 [Rhizobium leguminosarum bv. trifolii WSM597]|uniref:Uncharacterized protein n=1 Tax=Rhizobium leguminosarum bv. trifolii WSM597 TaxID=754764 RepID=J0GYE2_RHILT|nr:hypothetical protein [Rhizobium leguminosarum]EJB02608.1 hypothetical protein Rleg9DRAFT_1412 [Rhizobium leguminosarum bv. trifolii WSM597]
MSEYQYYEFQAIDRPLNDADRRALRDLSTRARITSTSFTNSYEWGDFKGEPADLMERWFDMHLYLANWGTRRLMIRFPKRLIDEQRVDGFLGVVDGAELRESGENLILDILPEEPEPDDDDWGDDGSGWLAALTPLREDVLRGDLRLFYLLWLMAVQAEAVRPEVVAPLPGIGPMNGALEAFAQFFCLDADLVAAAAERPAETTSDRAMASDAVQRFAAALPDSEKTMILTRLIEGDPHMARELRQRALSLSAAAAATANPAPTVAELQARAGAIRDMRRRKEEEWLAAERKRKEAEEARARRTRLNAIIEQGDSIWPEIEFEIERRKASGYDRAASLLMDLKTIAAKNGDTADFTRRLHSIFERHAQKERFIARLNAFGWSGAL